MRKMLIPYCIVFVIFGYGRPPQGGGFRRPSKPYISGDGFRAMADHVYDETDRHLEPLSVKCADIVFVKSDLLGDFFSHVHEKIKHPYILVTHNSDASAPGRYESFLDDAKILHWFGQNPTIVGHSKFTAIPIGVANRYVQPHGNVANFIKIFEQKEKSEPKKNYLLGMNFRAGTNLGARRFVIDLFKDAPFAHQLFSENHFEYLFKMAQAKYILCPRGNGLDCHRTWEALIVGAIPILMSSKMNELLDGLPALIVADWQDVSKVLLENVYSDLDCLFAAKRISILKYEYWRDILRGYQKEYRQK
jgi:hypothetical protein